MISEIIFGILGLGLFVLGFFLENSSAGSLVSLGGAICLVILVMEIIWG